MDRRRFLGFLAGLPLIGWMVPKRWRGREPFTASYWMLNDKEWQYRTKSVVSSKSAFSEVQSEVAEFRGFAVWNDVLTPKEMRALTSGASPLIVNPNKLVSYMPLSGTPTKQEEEWHIAVGIPANRIKRTVHLY